MHAGRSSGRARRGGGGARARACSAAQRKSLRLVRGEGRGVSD